MPALIGRRFIGVSILARGPGSRVAPLRRARTATGSTTSRLSAGRRGVALLDGALAHLECRIVARHEAGDHTIFVAAVDDGRGAPGPPARSTIAAATRSSSVDGGMLRTRPRRRGHEILDDADRRRDDAPPVASPTSPAPTLLFGGRRAAVMRWWTRWRPGHDALTLLDVGTGLADIPAGDRPALGSRRGARVDTIGLDEAGRSPPGQTPGRLERGGLRERPRAALSRSQRRHRALLAAPPPFSDRRAGRRSSRARSRRPHARRHRRPPPQLGRRGRLLARQLSAAAFIRSPATTASCPCFRGFTAGELQDAIVDASGRRPRVERRLGFPPHRIVDAPGRMNERPLPTELGPMPIARAHDDDRRAARPRAARDDLRASPPTSSGGRTISRITATSRCANATPTAAAWSRCRRTARSESLELADLVALGDGGPDAIGGIATPGDPLSTRRRDHDRHGCRMELPRRRPGART